MQLAFRTQITSKLQKSLLAHASLSSVPLHTSRLQHLHLDQISILNILKSYTARHALLEGRLLHAHIISSDSLPHLNVPLSNALINMYGKCGEMDDALGIFARMSTRDVVSWNILIASFIVHGHHEDALGYFKDMQEDGTCADSVTCISILSACGYLNVLEDGMKVHDMILVSGFDMDIVVQNALINMYGRCGCLEAARTVFEGSSQDDIISWNAMISAYYFNGLEELAQQLYYELHKKAMVPNRVTLISILTTFANKGALIAGRWIHAIVVGSDIEYDVVLGTTLVNLYGKGGCVEDACKAFYHMASPNVVSWNALIAVHAHNRENRLAHQIFNEMLKECFVANRLTFVNILDACAALNKGKRLHVIIQGSGLEIDLMVGNALINMYGKCYSIVNALDLFDSMRQRNDLTWSVMMTHLARSEQGIKAFELFGQMLQEGSFPNKVSFIAILDACINQLSITKGMQMHAFIVARNLVLDNIVGGALLNFYSKCGHMLSALEIFYTLRERDVICWSALITGFALKGQSEEALFFFNRMCQDGVMPNKVTYVSVLVACSSHVAQLAGKRIHALVMSCELKDDIVIANALINLYGKCGCLGDAQDVFDTMHERNTVSWSAMIAAYAQHGEDTHVHQLFYQMQHAGVRPNNVTFLSVISAWGHTGKVEEGYFWFYLMKKIYGIPPLVDHYNCMIDLAGRAGRLDEAEKLVAGMPSQITIVSLMALLSACKYQADVERGEQFARHAFSLFPDNAEPYIMLANIYSSVGRLEDAERVINRMRTKGLEL